MVLSHLDQLILPHPFRLVSQALTLRYPNPFSPHVITADTLERSWDPERGILRSTRLLLKRGTLPSWAPRGIIEKSETWVLEESSINMIDGTMSLSNRNIDHRRVIEVLERVTLRSRGEVTEATEFVRVTSSWGLDVIRRKIEKYGIGRFQRQSKNSKRGLELIIKLLKMNSPLRESLLNVEKINYPASLAPPSPLKSRLRELRLRAKEKQRLFTEMLRTSHTNELPSSPSLKSEEDQDHEDEWLTAEEEAELNQLEKEFSLDSASSDYEADKSRLHSKHAPHQSSRWFWWCRWRLDSDSSPKVGGSSGGCCHRSESSARE